MLGLVHRLSRNPALVNKSDPAAQAPATKQSIPDGVSASPFSRQLAADTSLAQAPVSATPVDASVVQPATLAAPSQPAASNDSSRAQSSELSAKGLQVATCQPKHPRIWPFHV